jgi:hypothetical protein
MNVFDKIGRVAAMLCGLAVVAAAPAALADPSVSRFQNIIHAEGRVTAERDVGGVNASNEIRRINLHDGKREVCVLFRSWARPPWEGGYRLTNREDRTTFATVRVLSDRVVRRCEILPAASECYLVTDEYDGE